MKTVNLSQINLSLRHKFKITFHRYDYKIEDFNHFTTKERSHRPIICYSKVCIEISNDWHQITNQKDIQLFLSKRLIDLGLLYLNEEIIFNARIKKTNNRCYMFQNVTKPYILLSKLLEEDHRINISSLTHDELKQFIVKGKEEQYEARDFFYKAFTSFRLDMINYKREQKIKLALKINNQMYKSLNEFYQSFTTSQSIELYRQLKTKDNMINNDILQQIFYIEDDNHKIKILSDEEIIDGLTIYLNLSLF